MAGESGGFNLREYSQAQSGITNYGLVIDLILTNCIGIFMEKLIYDKSWLFFFFAMVYSHVLIHAP